jgi:FkbM family methyltransferase
MSAAIALFLILMACSVLSVQTSHHDTTGNQQNPCVNRKFFNISSGIPPYSLLLGLRKSPEVALHPFTWNIGSGKLPRKDADGYPDDNEDPVKIMGKFKNSAIYIDVGANRGTTSFPIAMMEQKHIVHAFEPIPETFDLLCISRYLNQWQLKNRIHLVEAIVSNTDGVGQIYMNIDYPDNSAVGGAHVATTNVGQHTKVVTVPTVSLDTYIRDRNITHVDFLKVDTQGHELFVFQGAEKSLRAGIIKAVYAENDLKLTGNARVNPDDIVNFMKSVGFAPYPDTSENIKVENDVVTVADKNTSVVSNIRKSTYNILWLPIG